MANVLVEEASLQNIANSIREKTGTTDTYKPSEMASAISGIQSGGGSVPENGIFINKYLMNGEIGYPEEISLIGMSHIPDYYCYVYQSGLASLFFTVKKINFLCNPSSIGNNAFYNMSNNKTSEIPSSVKSIGNSAFYGNGIIEFTVNGDIKSIGNSAFGTDYSSNGKLQKFILPNVTSVPTLGSSVFYNQPLASGNGYIYVPNNLMNGFKTATNWSTYADQIRAIDLESIEINNTDINAYNNNKTITLRITYNGGATGLYHQEQEGYTLSVSGNATLDGNVLTLTDNAQVGDIITVTVTSTYDNSISSTQEIEVVYKEPSVKVNLNNGQWVDSGTQVNGNTVYKSDAGSYNINNGKSTAILTIDGYTSVKLYIRSYAESKYDYTEAFAIDTTAERAKGLFTTSGKQSATNYVECVYELDGNTHTIQIMYSKDISGNENDDRGYFYIGECS